MSARLVTDEGVIEISDEHVDQCLALVTAIEEYQRTERKARRHGQLGEAKDRRIWYLREHGCSDGAIADALGITVGQVHGAVKRCKSGRYSWAGDGT